jgi:hypothetical protein
MSSTKPIRLAEAAATYGLTVGALRAESRRGKLTIWRVAGKDFTSQAEIERMFELCRVNPVEPICGSDQCAGEEAGPNPPCGSSETDHIKKALDAAKANASRLKLGLPPISQRSTNPPGASVHLLKRPSPTS